MVYGVSGFTAIVDKQLSAKYEVLVDSAPQLIKALPWGPDFEVDVFRKPDFTVLEVLSFTTGGKYYRIGYPLVVHFCFFRYSGWNQREFPYHCLRIVLHRGEFDRYR